MLFVCMNFARDQDVLAERTRSFATFDVIREVKLEFDELAEKLHLTMHTTSVVILVDSDVDGVC